MVGLHNNSLLLEQALDDAWFWGKKPLAKDIQRSAILGSASQQQQAFQRLYKAEALLRAAPSSSQAVPVSAATDILESEVPQSVQFPISLSPGFSKLSPRSKHADAVIRGPATPSRSYNVPTVGWEVPAITTSAPHSPPSGTAASPASLLTALINFEACTDRAPISAAVSMTTDDGVDDTLLEQLLFSGTPSSPQPLIMCAVPSPRGSGGSCASMAAAKLGCIAAAGIPRRDSAGSLQGAGEGVQACRPSTPEIEEASGSARAAFLLPAVCVVASMSAGAATTCAAAMLGVPSLTHAAVRVGS